MTIPVVPIERIHPNRSNVRTDLGDLTELTDSIRAVGLLQPIVVRPDPRGFVIIDGHRRHAAALAAGLTALPCLASKARDRAGQLEVMLAAALHKQLEPMEQARAFGRLHDAGLSPAQIAARTGYSRATVTARLHLLALPPDAQDMVTGGDLTVTDAVHLARQVAATGTGTTRTAHTRTAYLDRTHPLAPTVQETCTHLEHRRPVGGIACGQCWETAIRNDARSTPPTTEGAQPA